MQAKKYKYSEQCAACRIFLTKIMPLKKFKCSKCGNEFEELVKTEIKNYKCPLCQGGSNLIYSGKFYTAKSGGCNGNCSKCSGCK